MAQTPARRGVVAAPAALAAMAAASAQTIVATFDDAPNSSHYGTAAANVGDLDGDGYPEVAIGAPGNSAGAPGGRVEVRNSRTGELVWARLHQHGAAGFGAQLEVVGDLDGDGCADLLVPSPGEDTSGERAGAIRVLSGATGAVLREWLGLAPQHHLGARVAVIGDIDGDGRVEFAYTTEDDPDPPFSPRPSVRVRSVWTGVDHHHLVGTQPDYENFASALDGVGDVDGDGIGDFLVGSGDSNRAGDRFGAVDVFSGATGARVLALDGDETQARFGRAAAGAGDFDGDTIPDIIVGSPQALYNGIFAGKAQVFSGANGARLAEFISTVQSDEFAEIVGSAGDMDGDGLSEVFAASIGYGSFASDRGVVVVYDHVHGERMRLEGPVPNRFFGHARESGDIDGDGLADLFVGTTWATNGGAVVAGRLEVFTLDPVNGGVLCAGVPNSTGERSRLEAASPSDYLASANDLTLNVSALPQGVLGYFLVSRGDGIVLLAGTSVGRLCISSSEFGRYGQDVLSSGATGTASLAPDTTAIPLATGAGTTTVAALPGDTFNFQFWHRDQAPGGPPINNFSDAVTVTFR